MSLKLFSKRILVAGILASAVGIALAQPKPATPAATTAATPDTAPAAPATIQIPPEIITVNGTGLSSSEWIQSLYQVAGPRVIEEWINLFAAREACRLSGITLDKKDIEAETDQLIKNLTAHIVPAPTKDLTDAEKGSLFGQFAQSKGLNPVELVWQLQQDAYLRALGKAAKDQATGKSAVSVTDDAVNYEFERENGDRANVMVYQFPDREAAQAVVAQAAKDKKTFPAVADEKRIPREPVVIPTSDGVKFEPAILRDTIKQVKEKDISAVTSFIPPDAKDDKDKKPVYVVLYVDEIKPKTVMNAAQMADEKKKLKDQMTDSMELQVGLNIVQNMRATKKIAVVINDPILSHYYEQLQAAQLERQNAATKPAATIPAPGTPTPAAPGH